MRHEIFTEPYRGFPVTIFWRAPKPYVRGLLIFGYQIEDELGVEGTGFPTELAACRAAGKVIDEVHSSLSTIKPRRGSRASGTNPRAMGTNPRAMRKRREDTASSNAAGLRIVSFQETQERESFSEKNA